jgi:predicted Zn-dependent peptidase
MEYEILELKNGLKIIHSHIKDAEVSHCGLIINAGTRDETMEDAGMAHFIEHVLFKGTKKRKAFHVLNRLESVGGELNAYTSKEETCIYASFLNVHYERSIEILADICFNSIYPAKEIEKEKEVIIDEIKSYQDNPIEQIHDEFEEIIFAGHALAIPILGTPESVKKLNRNKILKFTKEYYAPDNMVFSSVGNISSSRLLEMLNKYFGAVKPSAHERKRKTFRGYKKTTKIYQKETYQAHCIIGNTAYGYKHKNKIGFILLNNLFGGPGMNSRLNLSIREKYGYTYNIESNYTPYIDTGVFSIYLGTDTSNLDKSIGLVYKELDKLKNNVLGSLQLKSAKQQMIGQIAMAQESRSGLMMSLGKSLLNFGRVDTLKDIYQKIENLSGTQLMDIANEIFDEKKLSTLIYKS